MKTYKRKVPLFSPLKISVTALCAAIAAVTIFIFVGTDNEWYIICGVITALLFVGDLFIIIGAGGGGEKLSNFKGVETAGFLDDAPAKQGTEFCGHIVGSDLKELVETTDSKTVAIMLPIGAEATALKYAVEAMCLGQNVLTSFRSLPLNENQTLLKVAQQNGVQIKPSRVWKL